MITRETRDCDIIHPSLPEPVRAAAADFAALVRSSGGDLDDDWLNNGPSPLTGTLPPGWLDRVQLVEDKDAAEGWPDHVRDLIADLQGRLRRGV